MITGKRSSNIHEDTVLERNGMRNDGTFGVIDDLSVNYDGNRLLNVTDDAESLNYNGALDFNDGADMTAEYEYDSTGALTKDRNRGITGITYDLSHNPQTIVMNGGQIVNDYTSDGRKLCSTQSTGMTTTTDMYVDGLIIRNGAPLMWQFDGGYVSLGANSVPQSWNYYITDHLGSTRMVVDSRNIIKETINYYPFGSEMTMTPPAQLTSNPNWQPYRFTGKELVRQNGLNMYDFGARWYDVAGVPVWTSMDPLCEKNYPVTPYSYCNGDPVNAIDPDGKKMILVGSREQRMFILGQMQKLTNDKLGVRRSTGEVIIMRHGTKNIDKKLSVGTNLISDIINNKHTMKMKLGEISRETPKYRLDAINGKGSDSSIEYNNNNSPYVLTENKKTGKAQNEKMFSHIVLGHEMIHGYRTMEGSAKSRGQTTDYQYIDVKGEEWKVHNESMEELETVGITGDYKYTENKLREEQDINKRIKY